MNTNERREKCNETYNCRYCGEEIKWTFNRYWWGITSKDALSRHEENCEKNPNSPIGQLLKEIAKCKTQTRISECLNCKLYHNETCTGTEK